MQKLAVSGIAKVVFGMAVGLMQGEGAHHDGQRLERFRGVFRAALARHHALHVALDGKRHRQDELAVAGFHAERVAERERLAVRAQRNRSGKGY